MPDITDNFIHLVKRYNPEKRIYCIVRPEQAVGRENRGWRHEAEIVERGGSVMVVLSRSRVEEKDKLPEEPIEVPKELRRKSLKKRFEKLTGKGGEDAS